MAIEGTNDGIFTEKNWCGKLVFKMYHLPNKHYFFSGLMESLVGKYLVVGRFLMEGLLQWVCLKCYKKGTIWKNQTMEHAHKNVS